MTSEASTSGTKKTARIQGELPPNPRIAKREDDVNVSDEDEDGGASSAESEGPTEPVNREGDGLAGVILEREFEDKKKKAELEANDTQLEEVEADIPDDADLLADFPNDTDELELTHARLRSLKALHLERFRKTLVRLSLRQNLLTSLLLDDGSTPIETLEELEELDLYDNRLSSVKGLKNLSKLISLDLSFNLLRKVPASQLTTLKKLKTLYFIQNKISRIDGLESLADTLESIEFGGNKLRKIENLERCTRITELWLGKNKITRLEGMSTLQNLKILSIQSNRLVKLEGLEDLQSLEELYVSHNGIKKLEGLERNSKLRVLDIGNNFIAELENISHLSGLEEFWANGNLIHDFAQVETQLSGMKDLDTVYFEANPLQKTAGANYRRKVMLALPQVNQIDATFVHQR